MYNIKSIDLHNKADFIVYYSNKNYNTSATTRTTIKGYDFEDWYCSQDSKKKLWPTYEEMINDVTGLYFYMNKYMTYTTEIYYEEKYYGEEWYMRRYDDGDWAICPYDDLRDSEQDNV